MERHYRHPDSGVERILEELAQQGGDLRLIDDFAKRAAERAAVRLAITASKDQPSRSIANLHPQMPVSGR